MSLSDQPEEILIEQLRYLPLQDLLNACRTNLRISQVCQGARLWHVRLMDEFGLYDFSKIINPRDYYFHLMKKKEIIGRILSTVTEQFYIQNRELYDDSPFLSYQEFADFQRRVISQLSDNELIAITFMMNKLSDQMMHCYNDCGSIPQNILFFYPDFTSDDLSGRTYIILTANID